MNKPRTRSERGHLIREADRDMCNILKSDLINDEVVDFAVNFHGILTSIASIYTSDAIVDFIPELTKLLNRLDASIIVNNDLQKTLSDVSEEKRGLEKTLETERNRRKRDFEDSVSSEEKSEEEIKLLKLQIENLETTHQKLREDILTKNAKINLLRSDCEHLSMLVSKHSPPLHSARAPTDEFKVAKNTCKPRRAPEEPNIVHTDNRYSALLGDQSLSSACAGRNIEVQAQVHRPASPLRTSVNRRLLNCPHKARKKRVVVLADSQGRDMNRYLSKLDDEFEVFVYVKSGAKLKHVVRDGLAFVRDFSEEDFIILLAGSNDACENEPAQLTIAQGITSLCSLKRKTNVLVHAIPYRYDERKLNNKIYYLNSSIMKMIREYKGELNLSYGDVNGLLTRTHFTRRGLHYSRGGKRRLGEAIMRHIARCKTDQPRDSPSSPVTRTPPARSWLEAELPRPPRPKTPPRPDVQAAPGTPSSPAVEAASSLSSTARSRTPSGSATLPYETYAEALMSTPSLRGSMDELVSSVSPDVFLVRVD